MNGNRGNSRKLVRTNAKSHFSELARTRTNSQELSGTRVHSHKLARTHMNSYEFAFTPREIANSRKLARAPGGLWGTCQNSQRICSNLKLARTHANSHKLRTNLGELRELDGLIRSRAKLIEFMRTHTNLHEVARICSTLHYSRELARTRANSGILANSPELVRTRLKSRDLPRIRPKF